MKKILTYFVGVLMVFSVFTSCEDLNEPIILDNADKFIAFENTASSINEQAVNKVGVLVYVASTGTTGGSVTFAFDTAGIANPAIEGVDFNVLNTERTLNFSKGYGYDTIWVESIDNVVYDKDKNVNIVLSNPTNEFDLGANYTCNFTVVDNEHPLSLLIGTYSASAVSYFNGAEVWNITTHPDVEDESKLWFTNFVNKGTSSGYEIFGIVDLEAGTLKIPTGQELTSGGGTLGGFYGPSGDDDIPTGEYISCVFDEDGTISIADWFGSEASSGGWYNIYLADAVFTKTGKKVGNLVVNELNSNPQYLGLKGLK